MLLDQKRTKRMVRIVSIVCAVGFVGVLPVVLGLVVFGNGGSSNGASQLIKEKEKAVKANPNDLNALVELANQYRAANRVQDASVTLQKAIAVGPKNNAELNTLITGLTDNAGQKLSVLQSYTKSHPKDADAYFTYGTTAVQVGDVLTARLAFQRAAAVAPKGSSLRRLANEALTRLKNTPVPSTPTLPSGTTTGPATPATP